MQVLPSFASHPFQTLTPDLVLDALASVGLYGDGRLTALSSYENRVYLVHLEQDLARDALHDMVVPESVVVKFYRPDRWTALQIQEEHAFSHELMRAEIPVVGSLLLHGQYVHRYAGFSFSVSPRRGGRAPELDDVEVLEWIGRFLARIHTVGATKPFVYRPALDVQSFGTEPMDWLLSHNMVPLDVQEPWREKCEIAINMIANQSYFKKDANHNAHQTLTIRLHGDCHPGNIMWTPIDVPNGEPHFVDLDDARSGPAVQDLWMLLSGDRRQRSIQLSALIDGYEQFRPFNRSELVLIEPLRTLRLIHYSAWLARRWQDPIFPINFPWFGSSDYWTSQIHMLEEQIEAMQEEPLLV